MQKKPPSAILSFKCPRCRVDCEVVRYGGITFESCRSCEGLFLDKDELGDNLRPDLRPEVPAGGPLTAATLCSKCGSAMKNAHVKKRGIVLDFCPGGQSPGTPRADLSSASGSRPVGQSPGTPRADLSSASGSRPVGQSPGGQSPGTPRADLTSASGISCPGLWFDRAKYFKNRTEIKKPPYYTASFFCGGCGKESKFRPADHKSEKPPACPSCGGAQSIELHPQRVPGKARLEKTLAAVFFLLIAALIFLNRGAFEARFYTFAAEQNRYHSDTVDNKNKIMENREEFGRKNAAACAYYEKAYAIRPASIDRVRAEYAAEACGYADMAEEKLLFSDLYKAG